MPEMKRAASPVLTAVVVGVVVAGVIITALGWWLVYLGTHGQETLIVFGQHLNTHTTGILATYIGAVAIGAGAILRAFDSKLTKTLSGLRH
jgi:hypothetical protein